LAEAERIAKDEMQEQLRRIVNIAMEDGTSLMEQISKIRAQNRRKERKSWVEVTEHGNVVQVFGYEEGPDTPGHTLDEIRKRLQGANT